MKFRVRKPGSKKRLKLYKKRKAWRDLTKKNNNWHSWFAWFPVRVPTKGRMSGMTIVWLERVERQGKWLSIWSIELESETKNIAGWNWLYRFKGTK